MTEKRRGPEPHFNPGHKVDILLDKAAIAERFGVDPQTVQRWWNKGYLASHKPKEGRTVRCYSTEADVVAWGKIFYNVGSQDATVIRTGDSHDSTTQTGRRCCPGCPGNHD